MVYAHTDNPIEQQEWAQRVLDTMEEYHNAKNSPAKASITFDFADKDAREASKVMKARKLTPTEALDWAWKRKVEDTAEQEYGSTRVRFSLRGEHTVRLQFLAAIKRTTKEEISRTALQQFLAESHELNRTELSVAEMNDLLKETNPTELAELYEKGQL